MRVRRATHRRSPAPSRLGSRDRPNLAAGLLALWILATGCAAADAPSEDAAASPPRDPLAYFNLTPPGDTREVFAPGVVSTHAQESGLTVAGKGLWGMVKSPHAVMGLSTAARSGLTALCKGLSNEAVAHNVTINNLLPERFDTDRQKFMAKVMMERQGLSLEQAREAIAATINAKRFGQPEEFGDACAYLCSAQAGFISGQNLQLDGGSYAGLI